MLLRGSAVCRLLAGDLSTGDFLSNPAIFILTKVREAADPPLTENACVCLGGMAASPSVDYGQRS